MKLCGRSAFVVLFYGGQPEPKRLAATLVGFAFIGHREQFPATVAFDVEPTAPIALAD
jgi:hypothetical protein